MRQLGNHEVDWLDLHTFRVFPEHSMGKSFIECTFCQVKPLWLTQEGFCSCDQSSCMSPKEQQNVCQQKSCLFWF